MYVSVPSSEKGGQPSSEEESSKSNPLGEKKKELFHQREEVVSQARLKGKAHSASRVTREAVNTVG